MDRWAIGLCLTGAQGAPQAARPGLDGGVETGVAVSFAARHDSLRAGCRKHRFHALWKRLERRPLRVAATQDGIAQAGCLPGECSGGIEPRLQGAGAVRRTAVVGGGHHDQHALLRQCVGNGIQRRHLGVEAGPRGSGGKLFGDVLASAQAAAIQHVHRFAAAGKRGFGVDLRRGFGARRRGNRQPLARIAQPRSQAETVRFERQRFLDVEVIVVRVGQRKSLQDHGQRQLGFGQRKLAADAGAFAVTEGLVGVRVELRFVLWQETVDIEDFGAIPHRGVAMQRQQHGHHALVLADGVAAANARVFVGRNAKARGGRPQAQRFLQHALDHVKLREVRILRHGITRQHAVDLGVRLRQHCRMAQQHVERKSQQTAGGLMPGDQEGDDLEADVGVVQRLVRHRIARVEHQPQQVARADAAILCLTARADHLVHQLVHGGHVVLEPPMVLAHEAVFERQARELAHGFGQHTHHGRQERMQLRRIERIKAVSETRQ